MRGWQGGEDGTKVIIFEVDMPHCEENACAWNRPAVWALNARVSRKNLRICTDSRSALGCAVMVA